MLSDDELRALADALEPMAKAPRFEDFDVPAFCAWVRACADAQPVAWMHPDGRVVPAATIDAAYRDGGAMKSSLRNYTIPLYPPPAPAAPQAESIDPHMIVAEDRFPDEQAEPKREPLHKLLEYADLSDDCQYGTLSASVVRDLVNEALGIGGSDAE